MLDTSIKVKTDHFDGPLALLLLLIQKQEMNIEDLDLTKITKQYLDYLADMRELNFDVAGEYLYLAATLILLKSKTCISEQMSADLKKELGASDDLDITSESELIRRLEELQHFRKMGEKIWGLDRKGEHVFTRPKVSRKAMANSILVPMDLEKLTMAMVDFLFKQKRQYTIVRRDRLSIKEKLRFMKSSLIYGQKTTLAELISGDDSVEEKDSLDNIVITFISLLELARLRRVAIFQNEDRSDIYVSVVNSLEDFDIEQANGFDEEAEEGPKETEATLQ